MQENKKFYPYALRHNLMMRMQILKKKFPNFESFKDADLDVLFSKDQMDGAISMDITELRSCVFVNEGNFKFKKIALPSSAQLSPMYAICNVDINHDGYQDLVMGGNLYGVQPEMGRYDASYGCILINDNKGNFTDHSLDYNFSIIGEIRSVDFINNVLHVFRNNDTVISYKINSPEKIDN